VLQRLGAKAPYRPRCRKGTGEHLKASFTIEAATAADLERAMRAIQQHHLAFWDAMLWATARRAGCRVLISEDGHDGRNLDGVTFVNPFNDGNSKLLDFALPPVEPD
jgi:predicted nucleic acid-binding protein